MSLQAKILQSLEHELMQVKLKLEKAEEEKDKLKALVDRLQGIKEKHQNVLQ